MSRVTQDSAMPYDVFAQGTFTRYGPAFQQGHARYPMCNDAVLQPLRCVATTQVWALPRSLATTGGIIVYFLFLEVLRCFSSLGSPHDAVMMSALQADGLSHSEILGSTVICTYPRLIAAYHVLHRLREPRHPPYALSYFRLMSFPLLFREKDAHTSVVLIQLLSLITAVLLVSECQRSFSLLSGNEWRITDSNR